MKLITVLGAFAVAALFFFGLVFALAASVSSPLTRLTVSLMMFAVAFAILYYLTRKPKTVIQRLEFSGKVEAVALKCPSCSASVEVSQIKMISGAPYAKCSYCGNTFEVTEEPKW